MTTKTIPQGKILEIFEVLFGDTIAVRQITEHLSPAGSMNLARYVLEQGGSCGWFLADALMAAGAAGALTMMPPDIVKEAVKLNQLSGTLLENFGEIANICSTLFQSKVNGHVRLDRIGSPADFSDFPAYPTCSLSSFEVQFPRYGKGRFTLAIC